jgi:hypothetical protein
MKPSSVYLLILSIILPLVAETQWTYLGLMDKPILEFKIENNWFYAGTEYGLFKKELSSTDTTWSLVGFEGTRIYDFIVFSEDTVLICKEISPTAGDTVSLFITFDGGSTWNDYQNGFGADSYSKRCTALEKGAAGTNTIFARTGSCVARSQNNGMSWELVHGEWNNTNSASKNLFNFYSNGACWAGGSTGYFQPYLIRSLDFGNNWELFTIPPSYSGGDNSTICLLQNQIDANEILVGLGRRLLKSYDGANTWEYSIDNAPSESFCDIKQSTINDDLIFTASIKVLNALGECSLMCYGSNNFGESWEPVDSLELPQIPVPHYCCHLEIRNQNQTEELYFATSSGVYTYSSPTGVEESTTEEHGLYGFIHPNPFHSRATIRLYHTKDGNKLLEIYTLQGELLRSEIQFTSGRMVMDRNGLPDGFYIYSIRSEEGDCFYGKFMIE